MDFRSILEARRDGGRNSLDDLRVLADGAAKELIPDYQLSAWLMAAYLNPLDADETAWLTMAMAESGDRVDLTGLPKPWVDKHSTGGVGDKTSIVLIPLLAACGLTVVKMSGRGLGITGGTVDKLSSIPGFRLDLTPDELKDQAQRIGLALTGQTPNLAPADKVLYALRDATATVGSIPLIVSSILSKKLAGGAETVVLDVKCGRGAFMPTLDRARLLAASLSTTGAKCGLKTRIAISDMNQPLGRSVGNALEVREAIRVLQGEQGRFTNLCIELAGLVLEASGLAPDQVSGREVAARTLESGLAALKAREWFAAQGATIDVLAFPDALPRAKFSQSVLFDGPSGWVQTIDAETIGKTVVAIGGGRRTKTDSILLGVGLELDVEVGSPVARGSVLCTVHAESEQEAVWAAQQARGAFTLSETPIQPFDAFIEAV
ncbi:MAG: thymidine phosphorylase [Fimbriimonas sp.]|nr:thymidine phosphorylase [Fimbriimonas sp.]